MTPGDHHSSHGEPVRPSAGAPYPTAQRPGVPYPPTAPYPPVPPTRPYPLVYQVPVQAGPAWSPVYVPALLPPARQRWQVVARRAGLIGLAAVLAVGVLVGVADVRGAFDTTATWRNGAVPVVRPPAQDAPAAQWSSWARRTIGDAMAAQSKALLAGNEAGYLDVVDQANTRLLDDHRRRFKVLRALGLGNWTQAVSGSLIDSGAGRGWRANLRISYCFGPPTCLPITLIEHSTWELRNDLLLLVDLAAAGANAQGPRPWEVDDLRVAKGERVVIATTRTNAGNLTDAITIANTAAAVADRFARWHAPPLLYVAFLADRAALSRWYGLGLKPGDWVGGITLTVELPNEREVMIGPTRDNADLERLLIHEFTHVSSLAGPDRGDSAQNWWLTEGLAEYATMLNRPLKTYPALDETKQYVRHGWNGDPVLDPPGKTTARDVVAGRYGIAFLSVRRLADRYGEAKMLDFFGRMVHDGANIDAAAKSALGVSWTAARADCVKYVRSA